MSVAPDPTVGERPRPRPRGGRVREGVTRLRGVARGKGGGAAHPQPAAMLLRHAGLPAAVALSGVMNLKGLSKNGYANIFYSAGVDSMLRSLHNSLFVSFDPGGLITVDKPPLALWVQLASAKIFGFSPMSLLVPGAIEAMLAVALLYLMLARRLGAAAALAGALALAIFPSFVAVSRDNGVDPLLLLLMLAACGAALAACESGRMRWLIACAVLVGLAFNTKTLAAYLVAPGIALGYPVCAPGRIGRRLLALAAAAVVMGAVSFGWIAFVEATPASQRPYIGSSSDNTELALTFEYNGLGRVEGQLGGPGTVKVREGAFVPAQDVLFPYPPGTAQAARVQRGLARAARLRIERARRGLAPARRPLVLDGREVNPIPFGGPPGLLRLFGTGLGDQGGWLLPFALLGLIALAVLIALERRERAAEQPDRACGSRRDPRLALLFVLGGWFVVEAVLLSSSKGIVHPYYMSGLAPGAGAMIGAGFYAIARLARGGRRLAAFSLMLGALATTVAVEAVLMHEERYWLWFVPVLIAGAGACLLALLIALLAARRLAPVALALSLALVLVAPAAYASTTWLAPVEGTFPMAGPTHDAGSGGYGVEGTDLAIDRALVRYVRAHHPARRWAILTVASDQAAPLILMGLDAGALAGYSGTDQALSGAGLARLVRDGQARYVLLGGEYSDRGGNAATRAVLRACRQLRAGTWDSPVPFPNTVVLFDCAGRAAQLRAS